MRNKIFISWVLGPRSDSEWTWDVFRRVWATTIAALILVSWPLWTADRSLPCVPMVDPGWFGLSATATGWVTPITVAAMLLGLTAIAVRRAGYRIGFLAVLSCGLVLVALDQNRLQPWFYQGLLYASIFAALPDHSARRWITALTVSVYAYSASGKFDQQFIQTVGQDFVDVVLRAPRVAGELATPMRRGLAIAFPIAELSIAVGLALPPTRRLAAIAAMAMHVVLFLMLGPLGLRHGHSVLIWNVFLGFQAWWLFVRRPPVELRQPIEAAEGRTDRALALAVRGFLVIALVMPLWERRGWWDHWLSWSLYSPHTSRVEIEVHDSALGSLPPRLSEFVRPEVPGERWLLVSLGEWSTTTLGVPIYPQARYQLGVAREIAKNLSEPGAIRVRQRGVADRVTGHRSERFLLGRDEIFRGCDAYWLLPPSPEPRASVGARGG